MSDYKALKLVFRDEKGFRAEIVRLVLEENGVPARVETYDRSPYNLYNYSEVYVRAEDEARAQKLIENEINFD